MGAERLGGRFRGGDGAGCEGNEVPSSSQCWRQSSARTWIIAQPPLLSTSRMPRSTTLGYWCRMR
jgi:hypothetical protein